MAPAPTWLCPTPLDRDRYLETSVWLVRARALALLALTSLMVLAGTPLAIGLPPLVVSAVGFLVSDRIGIRRPRPEYWGFGAWCLSILCLCYIIARTGGPASPYAIWILISTPGLLSRYSIRGIVVGTGLSFAALSVALLVGAPDAGVDVSRTVSPVLLLCVVTALCWAMMRSETRQRAAAIVDPLTGMFNRKGLDQHIAALDHQAHQTGSSVAAIMCDIDYFKRVNDAHGHAVGDVVLKEAAYCIRSALRAFDAAFRVGGEEFLVLLAATDEPAAIRVAERMREGIAAARPAGTPITASLGVAGDSGDQLSVSELVERADQALYVAKQSGRNRVVALPPGDQGPHPRHLAEAAA